MTEYFLATSLVAIYAVLPIVLIVEAIKRRNKNRK